MIFLRALPQSAWNTVEGTAAVGPSHFGIDSIGRVGLVVTVVAPPVAMAAASGVPSWEPGTWENDGKNTMVSVGVQTVYDIFYAFLCAY